MKLDAKNIFLERQLQTQQRVENQFNRAAALIGYERLIRVLGWPTSNNLVFSTNDKSETR
jgi:hypothetical protein